jgi:four helix bundle protein
MTSTADAKNRSHRALVVWQRAMELVGETYRITCAYPKAEQSGLVAQMRRAVISIAANIAEGNARRTTRDYLRFLAIANGSLREIETLSDVSEMVGHTSHGDLERMRSLIDEVGRMLARLCQSLHRRLVP